MRRTMLFMPMGLHFIICDPSKWLKMRAKLRPKLKVAHGIQLCSLFFTKFEDERFTLLTKKGRLTSDKA